MPREINLEWNRTTGEVTPSEGYRLKRNENVTFIVQPKTARVASTFATGWALVLTLKVKGNYDDTPLLAVTSWTDAGDGTYTKTVQVSSTEIDEALEADATLTDDLAEIDCVADLNLSISGGAPEKSDTISVTLQNCVSNASDGTPTSTSVALTASGYTASASGIWFGRWSSGAGAIQQGTFGSGLSLNTSTGVLTASGSGITINSTTITSGTSGRILYDNAGTVGEKITTGTGSVVLRNTPTERGIVSEIYIAIRTDGQTGTGTKDDPLDGTDLTALRTANPGSIFNGTGKRIYFGIGTFYITAYTGAFLLYDNWEVIGESIDQTIIKLSNGVVQTATNDMTPLITSGTITHCRIENLTIDLNASNQGIVSGNLAGYLNGWKINGRCGTVRNVKVIGPYAKGGEGFPCAINHTSATDHDFSIIEGCIVKNPVAVNGMTVISIFDETGSGRYVGGRIEDCSVYADSPATGSIAGIGGRQWKNMLIHNNRVWNVDWGMIIDTENFLDVDFASNRIWEVTYGMLINGSGTYDIRITDNYIETNSTGENCIGGGTATTTLNISNNRFISTQAGKPAFSLHASTKGCLDGNIITEPTASTIPSALVTNGNVTEAGASLYETGTGKNVRQVSATLTTPALTTPTFSGQTTASAGIAIRGSTTPASGSGIEIYSDGGNTNTIRAYDRTTPGDKPLQYIGASHTFYSGASIVAVITSTGITLGVDSTLAGTIVLCNATNSNTVTVQTGTTSGSYTITLPTAAPAGNGYGMSFTSAGVASFAALFDPASPGEIGGTTAAAGTFTTLSGTTSVTTPTLTSSAGLTISTTANNNLVLTPGGTGITTSSKRIDSSVAAGSVAFSFSTYAANTGFGVDSGYVTVFYNGHQAYQISDAYTVVKSPNGNPVTFQLICWGTNIASFYGHPSAPSNLFLQNTTTALRTDTCNTFTSYTSFESFKVDWKTTANLCRTGTSKGSGGGSARNLQVDTGDIAREFHAAVDATLTESTATTFCTISLAASKSFGARLICTVYADDGTDFQSLTSQVSVDAVAKATTITATVTQVDNTTAASAGGTLTCTYTVVDSGANTVQINANAASSLTQTTLKVRWSIVALNHTGTPTITAA